MGSKPDIPSFLLPDNYTGPSWPSLTSNTQLYLLAGACRAQLGASPRARLTLVMSPAGIVCVATDMWLFVTLWTFVLTTAIYMLAGVWILVVFGKSKLAWVVVPLFVLFGAITALLAGGIVGTP